MGVQDLLLLVRRNRRVVLEQVDLVEVAKQSKHGALLLVDGSSILHTLYINFLEAVCAETKNWYTPIYGGEYAAFEHYVYRIVHSLEKANIHTSWYFDGVRSTFDDDDDNQRQIEKWKVNRKWEAQRIAAAWQSAEKADASKLSLQKLRRQGNVNEPLLLQTQLIAAIKRAGGRVYQKMYGDADRWIVQRFQMIEGRPVTILSDDSDFAIFPNVNSTSLKYKMFDATNELRLNRVLDLPDNSSPPRLVCMVLRSTKLAEIFQLNFTQLAELAAICGNDYTRKYRDQLLRAASIPYDGRITQALFFDVANFIRQYASFWNCPGICQLTYTSFAVRTALMRATEFYSFESRFDVRSTANSVLSTTDKDDLFDDEDLESVGNDSDEDDDASETLTNLDVYEKLVLEDPVRILPPAFVQHNNDDVAADVLYGRVRTDGYPLLFVSIFRGFYWSLSPPVLELPLVSAHANKSASAPHTNSSKMNVKPDVAHALLCNNPFYLPDEAAVNTAPATSAAGKRKQRCAPANVHDDFVAAVERELGRFELRLRPLRRILYAYLTEDEDSPVREFILPDGPFDYVLGVAGRGFSSVCFTVLDKTNDDANHGLFARALTEVLRAFKHGISATRNPHRSAHLRTTSNNLNSSDSENESASLSNSSHLPSAESRDSEQEEEDEAVDHFEKPEESAFRLYLLQLLMEVDRADGGTISLDEFKVLFCAVFALAPSGSQESEQNVTACYKHVMQQLDLLSTSSFVLQPSRRCLVLFGRLQLLYECVRWFAALFFLLANFPEPRTLFNGTLFAALFASTDDAMRICLSDSQLSKVSDLLEDVEIRFSAEYSILLRLFFSDEDNSTINGSDGEAGDA